MNSYAYGVPVWQREGRYEVIKHEEAMAMLKPAPGRRRFKQPDGVGSPSNPRKRKYDAVVPSQLSEPAAEAAMLAFEDVSVDLTTTTTANIQSALAMQHRLGLKPDVQLINEARTHAKRTGLSVTSCPRFLPWNVPKATANDTELAKKAENLRKRKSGTVQVTGLSWTEMNILLQYAQDLHTKAAIRSKSAEDM